MAQKMSELKARFELARRNVAALLEQGEGAPVEAIVAADRELSEAFSQVLDATLMSNEERVARIEFLLQEIVSVSDRDGLVSALAEKAIDDVRRAYGQSSEIDGVVSEAS